MTDTLVCVVTLLSLCVSVHCGIFDDKPTVTKARCYANCLTLVSIIPLNDFLCESVACTKCKSPCDKQFVSFSSCNATCNSNICEQSCKFLDALQNWTSIYKGTTDILPPGVATATATNVTELDLSWQPSKNYSGSVVYLLKLHYSGDVFYPGTKPMTGVVVVGDKFVLTANQTCFVVPKFRKSLNGIDFAFTVVALTESSNLAQGQKSSPINFIRGTALEAVEDPLVSFDPTTIGDKLKLQVTVTPPPDLVSQITKYGIAVSVASGNCGLSPFSRFSTTKGLTRNVSVSLWEKTTSCNIRVKVYSMIKCLLSKPKEIIYQYKGCHDVAGFDRTLCCSFQPEKTPDTARTVGDLAHSPLQTTNDFRFTTQITWSPPTYSCPVLKNYDIKYRYATDWHIFGSSKAKKYERTSTNATYFNLVNLEPGKKYIEFEVKPKFGTLDIGVNRELRFNLSDVPRDKTSIQTVRHNVLPYSISRRFAVNISWEKPDFNYSVITQYNISYQAEGDAPKHNVTSNLSLQVTGLFYGVKFSYQILPLYRDPWIQAEKTKEQIVKLPAPKEDLMKVQNLTSNMIDTSVYNITWEKPLFKHSAVLGYKIYYELNLGNTSARKEGTEEDLLDTKRHFKTPLIRRGQEFKFQITPKFSNPYINGQTTEMTIAGGPLPTPAPRTQNKLAQAEIAGIIIGVCLLFLMIVLIAFFLWRETNKKKEKEGKPVSRKRGAVIDHWEVFRDKLHIIEVIGEGAFGKVFKGKLDELPEQSSKYSTSISIRRKSTKSIMSDDGYVVAVKMLHDMADDDQRTEFLQEINLMKDVGSHRNIVNMLGCGTLCDPMFLIVEYLPNGDLLHYLRKRRGKVKTYPETDPRGPYHSTYCKTYFNSNLQPLDPPALEHSSESGNPVYTDFNTIINGGFQDNAVQLVSVKSNKPETKPQDKLAGMEYDDEIETVTPGDLMAFAWQVSQGMEFLAKRGYVHRDLAARNVLVGENKEAKIADFGLTRHMYDDLYRAKTNRRLPIKWMSMEAIFDQKFTTQSDVWAYGVLLWEIVTLGGSPYPTKSVRELVKALKEGYRMEQPEPCDNEVYQIMLHCWKEDPDKRPTFTAIRNHLEEMMMRDNPYFDPTSIDESRDYYNVPSFNSVEEDSDGLTDDMFDAIFGGRKPDSNEELVIGSYEADSDKDIEKSKESDKDSDKEERQSEPEKYVLETKEKNKDINFDDIEAMLNRKQFSMNSFSA